MKTIKEIQEQKKKLKNDLIKIVSAFEGETNCQVHEIKISRIDGVDTDGKRMPDSLIHDLHVKVCI